MDVMLFWSIFAVSSLHLASAHVVSSDSDPDVTDTFSTERQSDLTGVAFSDKTNSLTEIIDVGAALLENMDLQSDMGQTEEGSIHHESLPGRDTETIEETPTQHENVNPEKPLQDQTDDTSITRQDSHPELPTTNVEPENIHVVSSSNAHVNSEHDTHQNDDTSTTGKEFRPEILTTNGNIRGFTEIVNGKTVYTFLGIPFAMPPIGNLRFKRPVPKDSWTDTLDVTEYSASCPQLLYHTFPGNPGEDMWNPKTPLSEDCLYLNIWTPAKEIKENNKLSTLVWIFGGSFNSGSSSLGVYNGKYLAAYHDIIVVSMNYRLGPLGFLYLGEEDVPGNVGLLDQNLAMKWIHDNIELFGGDQQKITLMGESAGAGSVHLHVLSDKSRGYFSAAIMQSGSALAPWSHQEPKDANITAHLFSKVVGCHQESVSEIIECLRSISAEKLVNGQFMLPSRNLESLAFSPTTDNYFLVDSPSNYVRCNNYAKVPLLLGVNKNEATYFIAYEMHDDPNHESLTLNETQFLSLIPGYTESTLNSLSTDAIIQQYETFPQKRMSFLQLADAIRGDYRFKCPTLSTAVETARRNSGTNTSPNIYVYSFEHRSSTNPWPLWTGVLHGDEIEYIFGMPLKQCSNFTSEEVELAERMMAYWTNFAKTGDPNAVNPVLGETTTEWPKYQTGDERYLVLDCSKFVKTGTYLRRKECRFWSHLYPKLRSITEQCAPVRPSDSPCHGQSGGT